MLPSSFSFLTFSLNFLFYFLQDKRTDAESHYSAWKQSRKSSLIYQKEPKIYDNVQGMAQIKEGDATFTQVLQMTDWPRSSIMLETKTSKQ